MSSRRTRLRLLFTLTVLLAGHPHRAGWTLGSALLIAGALLHALGAGYLTKRAALATAGPYRFVRNPLYVADLLRDLGVLFACHFCRHPGTRWVWAIAAAYFVAMFGGLIRTRVLRREEPELLARFGDAYREYVRRVPRFFPRLLPAPALGPGRFSLATLRLNHELARLVAMLLLVGFTYFRWEMFHHDFAPAVVLDDPWETSLFLALPVALVASKLRGREPGWPRSVPLGIGRVVARLRTPLALAPLAYALFSARWEWGWTPGIWIVALPLCGAGLALRAARPHGAVGDAVFASGAALASELAWLVPATALWAWSVATLANRYETTAGGTVARGPPIPANGAPRAVGARGPAGTRG